MVGELVESRQGAIVTVFLKLIILETTQIFLFATFMTNLVIFLADNKNNILISLQSVGDLLSNYLSK